MQWEEMDEYILVSPSMAFLRILTRSHPHKLIGYLFMRLWDHSKTLVFVYIMEVPESQMVFSCGKYSILVTEGVYCSQSKY